MKNNMGYLDDLQFLDYRQSLLCHVQYNKLHIFVYLFY